MSANRMGGDVDYVGFVRHIESLGFRYEGQGSFRAAYRRGKIVVKVPRNGDGICDNRTESMAWHKYKSRPTSKGYSLAPCRMLPNGCQMMVVVDREVSQDIFDKEDWARRIESSQVGIYRGHVVAFDYALNIPERTAWEEESGLKSEWFYATGWNNEEHQ